MLSAIEMQSVLIVLGFIALTVLVIYIIFDKYLCGLVDRRWPLRYPCKNLDEVRDHVEQHYKRAFAKCVMHLDSPQEFMNIGIYKYWFSADTHIFYFIIFKDIKRTHNLYDDFCEFIRNKGCVPENGITIRIDKCERRRKNKILRDMVPEYKYYLTCEIKGPDEAMDLIGEAVDRFGKASKGRPLFSVRVTGDMNIADDFTYGMSGFIDTFKKDITGKTINGRPYQRWHKEGPRLTYWALVYLKELIFGRKVDDPFAPYDLKSDKVHNTENQSTTRRS